ncbi:endonuclease/exonuclease/phosphatase [Streptomyces luteolifulvus]|uniref:Endonuclease/exonuclease/phosphatase n=1 Tax=Streptomyces luteolifulvus TaxID=2615112 RepID=A0A6H9UZ52_9ACTN|nr:endonuclease/exonuclease/phosphatase [Streptomyces luteolifulvus]
MASRPEHVLVLTETAPSEGCEFLAAQFWTAGYHVTFPRPERGERGVMIVSRVPIEGSGVRFGYLPHRAVSVTVATEAGPLDIIGLYVPSRDATEAKTERKRQFLQEAERVIPRGTTGARLIIGDFNILEPKHEPRYPFFKPFEYAFYEGLEEAGYVDAFRHLAPTATEYSWVGRTGDGYRYDHAHVSVGLAGAVRGCLYLHEPRTRTDRLTDHSTLAVQLDVTPVEQLPVGNPTGTAGALF